MTITMIKPIVFRDQNGTVYKTLSVGDVLKVYCIVDKMYYLTPSGGIWMDEATVNTA